MEVFVVCILAFFLTVEALRNDDCIIDLNDKSSFPSYQPIFLQNHLEPKFIEPNKDGKVILEGNDQLRIACTGTGNYFDRVRGNYKELDIRCLSGNKYEILDTGDIVFLQNLNCTSDAKSETKVLTPEKKCGPNKNNTLIDVGFSAGGTFLSLYEVCYDEGKYRSLYSKHTMTPNISGMQVGHPRPKNFFPDNWFNGVAVSRFYRRSEQIKTFSKILGDNTLAKEYIKTSGNHFLSKGHLVAKADLIFGTHQTATFHYINVAPQWQTLNGNNWNSIEQDTKLYVANKNRTLEIYTGTLGTASLPDGDNTMKNLHLFYGSTYEASAKIPVPQYFYKILYDPETGEGVAFLGWNNPNIMPHSSPCVDQCSKLSWLSWVQNRNDLERGVSFCCAVPQIQKRWSEVPSEIKVNKLLV